MELSCQFPFFKQTKTGSNENNLSLDAAIALFILEMWEAGNIDRS